MQVLHALAAAALGAALGGQLVLSLLVAPAVFRRLDRPAAGALMEAMFPGYYLYGLATTGLALLLALTLALRERGAPARWGTVTLLALVLAGTVYAGHVLLPRARAARERVQATPAGDRPAIEFSRLHRRAAALNVALFAASVMALGLHAAGRRR